MVARQIGEHRNIESGTVDASLREAMRRHLHRTGDGTLLPVVGKALLQFDGVGRGVERGGERAGLVPEWGKAVADGADDSRFPSQLREGLRYPVCHRGLAVGTGDTNHVQRARRLAVDVCGDFADAGLQANHPGVGGGERRIPLKMVRFPQHPVDALRHGLRDKIPPVARLARIGGEYFARRGLAAVADEFADCNAEPLQNVRHRLTDGLGCGWRRDARRAGLRHHAPPLADAAFSVIFVSVSGASGGSPSMRRLAPITCAKTGPATLPP